MFRIDLRRLILWISLLSVVLVLAGGLHASYLVQRDLLLRNTLEVNRAYASKLASATDTFLTDLQRYLSYSADMLAGMENRPELMDAETRRQEQQLGHFNSSYVVLPQGKVLAVSTSSFVVADEEEEDKSGSSNAAVTRDVMPDWVSPTTFVRVRKQKSISRSGCRLNWLCVRAFCVCWTRRRRWPVRSCRAMPCARAAGSHVAVA